MSKLSLLFEHTQRYTREVFAERLKSEGFSSYMGHDIHWYRLVNNELVQAVYFINQHTNLASFMQITYGAHPLYIPPIFQKSPHVSILPGYEQMNGCIPEPIPGSTPDGFIGTHLIGASNRPYRVPDVLIMCPDNTNNGLTILEQILPVMERLNTPMACYEMHKKVRKEAIENDSTGLMSSYFVDEVLYWEDRELYPYCRGFVDNGAWCLENFQRNGMPIGTTLKRHWERCKVLSQVFRDESFAEYLQTYPRRAQETLRLLERYAGIRAGL